MHSWNSSPGFFCDSVWKEAGMNRGFYKSTLGSLHDINKTYLPSFPKEYYNKDKNKLTTKLAPFYSQAKEQAKSEAFPEKMEKESSPLPPPKTLPVLGKPPDCGTSGPTSLYSDGDPSLCQAYCCILESSHSSEEKPDLSNSVKMIDIHESPLDDRSLSFLPPNKNNDVIENPPPTGSNTIDQKKKVTFSKEILSRSKLVKKSMKRNVDEIEEQLVRRRRNPDDFNEENRNFDGQNESWWSTGNGISVTVLASNVNQTLGPEFCAFSNSEYTHCIDRNAVNSTYHIPLSKYMADDYLIVKFQLKHQRDVKSCQKIIHHTDFSCQKRSTNSVNLIDSGNAFHVDISNYWSIAVKFRIPLNHSQPPANLCDLKDGLGVIYLEYNLHFYRDCED